MEKARKVTIVLLLVLLFIMTPFFEYVKSVVVMSVYSAYEYSYSVMSENNMKIHIPGGTTTFKKDWYPFVMTFNPSSAVFSRLLGRDADISIMYNFAAFDYPKGRSNYYDQSSDYFSGFYGAYVIKDKAQAFGFHSDGSLNSEELSIVPDYDMRILVLKSIGLNQASFDYQVTKIEPVDAYVGFEDWTLMESTLYTNSPIHEVVEDHQAYIQYGKPSLSDYKDVDDFEPIELKGRVYAKYFKEQQVTVCFYVIAVSSEVLDETDEAFLKKSILRFK